MDAGAVATISPFPFSFEDWEQLGAYAARAEWPKGFRIYQCGAPADGVFLVVRGRVVLRSRARAGRGFIPSIAGPFDTFGAEGLSPGGVYATDAAAEEETETLHVSSRRFRQLLRERPQQAIALIGQVMSERSALLSRLRELTTLSVEQRLVTTLLRLAERGTFTDDAGAIVLCNARYRLLCELVGATRESISLVLSRLAGEGLVERRGTDTIIPASSALASRVPDDWPAANGGNGKAGSESEATLS